MKIEVDQVWRQCDYKIDRLVVVTAVGENWVTMRECDDRGIPRSGTRPFNALFARFNGGYKFVRMKNSA